MSLTKVTRLNKAAREFNVGRETIVDFLEKKGFKIDTDPNTKLTSTMVDLLTDEFSMEKSVKEESRKKGLGSVKRETISLEDRKRPEPDPEDYDDDDDIIIRGMSVKIDDEFKRSVEPHQSHKKKPEQPVEEKQPEKKPEAQPVEAEIKPAIEEVEVVTPLLKKEPEPEIIEPRKIEPVTEEVKEPVQGKVEEKKAEPITPQIEKPTPEDKEAKETEVKKKVVDVEKPREKLPIAVKHTPVTIQEAEPSATAEKQEVIQPQIPAPEEPTEKIQDTPVAEKAKETAPEDNANEPKVLGMIDLSSINERTKPPRKTTAEKRKEKEDRKKQSFKKPATEEKTTEEKLVQAKIESSPETPKLEKTPPPHPVETQKPDSQKNPYDAQFLETKFEKLAGPNIVGRIELPVIKKPEKKKPVASSSDEKVKPKRKKRRRIKKDQPATAQGTPGTGSATNAGSGHAHTGTGTSHKKTDSKPTDNKPKPPVKLVKGRKARFEPKPELTDEQVQKQIKETLARLSGTGKSKTSKYRRIKRDQVHKQQEQDALQKIEDKKVITVAEFVTANELASMMDVPVTNIISVCMQLGLFVSINQRLDAETITLVAEEFGFSVKFESAETAIDLLDVVEDAPEDLEPRSPIVTVMGHVDHGKTKLLDYIRSANVVAGEAGGITQHIGAYEVILENGRKITFLDTPGHEAFTAMRARGAKVTDVAIIVVAADDSVMPQTVEAINHAQAANVPIVFAINKIDKPTANAERIKDQLSQMNILVEDWGGKYQSQEISAKAGLNIEELLEKVLLEAELLDLKANPSRQANGTIIESSLDKGRGYVSTLLVQNGSLKIGDLVLAGSHFGRVKAMYNERNQAVTIAGPSAPVLMLGMNGAPQAGDFFKVMKDEREAKGIASKRQQLQREQGLRTQKHITLDEIGRRIAIGDFKELNVIVKGDVDGSVEALSDSLLKQSTEEVQVNVIHKSVGPVTETDVMLASASNAIIIAFQVRPSVSARKLAEREQIDIRTYSIIYAAIEEIKSAIEGMLSPDIEEKILCNLEVREVFKITKVGTIAGCLVLDGTITRNTMVRLIREGIVLYSGRLGQLKRFKDDVKEVSSGYECGLNIENFNDIKIGDIIEGFEEIKVARKLA